MAVSLTHEPGLVRLVVSGPSEPSDGAAYIGALDALNGIDGPFVLIVSILTPLELTQNERKTQNLWFKASRMAMNERCRALALVRPEPTAEMQRTFQGLWSFPVLVTGDLGEAETFLCRHMAEGQQQ